jgi:dihydroflavonol-4-reductase
MNGDTMKVLITGATGFLGSHLCRRMAAAGYQVRILLRPTSSLVHMDGLALEKSVGDILDAHSLRAGMRGCDYVIHAAGARTSKARDLQSLMRIHAEGTRNVAQAAHAEGVRRLLHFSSSAAIGISPDPERPANEEFAFNLDAARWPYHFSRHQADAEVLAEAARGLDAVVVNAGLICGPGATGYRIAEPMQKAIASRLLPYAPGGLCLVHMSDVEEGVLLALHKGRTGERYILGGDNVTFQQMDKAFCQRLGLTRLRFPVPARLAELKAKVSGFLQANLGMGALPGYERETCYQFYDSKKAREELGYQPGEFASILDELACYWRDQSGQGKTPSTHI